MEGLRGRDSVNNSKVENNFTAEMALQLQGSHAPSLPFSTLQLLVAEQFERRTKRTPCGGTTGAQPSLACRPRLAPALGVAKMSNTSQLTTSPPSGAAAATGASASHERGSKERSSAMDCAPYEAVALSSHGARMASDRPCRSKQPAYGAKYGLRAPNVTPDASPPLFSSTWVSMAADQAVLTFWSCVFAVHTRATSSRPSHLSQDVWGQEAHHRGCSGLQRLPPHLLPWSTGPDPASCEALCFRVVRVRAQQVGIE